MKTRADLSFTEGVDGRLTNNWNPSRPLIWNDGFALGERYAEEVIELCRSSEWGAVTAIQYASSSLNWRNTGAGPELGFMEVISKLALIGMRAVLSGEPLPEPSDQWTEEGATDD